MQLLERAKHTQRLQGRLFIQSETSPAAPWGRQQQLKSLLLSRGAEAALGPSSFLSRFLGTKSLFQMASRLSGGFPALSITACSLSFGASRSRSPACPQMHRPGCQHLSGAAQPAQEPQLLVRVRRGNASQEGAFNPGACTHLPALRRRPAVTQAPSVPRLCSPRSFYGTLTEKNPNSKCPFLLLDVVCHSNTMLT